MPSVLGNRFLACLGCVVVVLLLLNLAYVDSRGRGTPWGSPLHEAERCDVPASDALKAPSDPEYPLLSVEPKVSFRENLRKDTKYITTWPSNGWTNDVMAFINLMYLGLLTDRVPILARFAPTHVGDAAGFVPFSEVFDLPRLSKAIKTPVLEWQQLKNLTREPMEDLGCWGTHTTLFNGGVLHSTTENHMGLDVSYTPIPTFAHIDHNAQVYKASFMALAALSYPKTRATAIASPPRPVIPSRNHQHTLPPDEQLECFDFTYDLGMHEAWEWEFEWSPAWHKVGRHTYFNPDLVKLTHDMVMRALGLPESAPLPLMITMHIRRADFKVWCGDVVPAECLAPVSAYVRRLEQVKNELRDTKGVTENIEHVLVSSDETDPEWWRQVHALGWKAIDHDKERTEEQYGRWYPVLIDVVSQSFGKGFVGTDRSTLSLVSGKRVVDWNDGAYERVRWGWVGADD